MLIVVTVGDDADRDDGAQLGVQHWQAEAVDEGFRVRVIARPTNYVRR